MAYRGPRRLNVFTVVLIAAALAAGYWLWRFFPAYFNAWTVDHLLSETGAATYKLNVLDEGRKTAELKLLLDKLRAEIQRQASIDDPELSVNIDLDDQEAVVSADYDVEITHPMTERVTKLHFHRVRKVDVKRVNWE